MIGARVPVTFGASRDDAAAAGLPPTIAHSERLSAQPVPQADGASGPINRIALDIINFGPAVAGSDVECVYAGNFRYRCKYSYPPLRLEGTQTRVEVLVPDVDRGTRVVLRFSNRFGASEFPVEIANPPQLVHQIVTSVLAAGGVTKTGADGRPAPVLTPVTSRIDMVPALAVTLPYDPAACDRLYAQFRQVSATDPVFTSAFGPLSGTVLLLEPIRAGTPVSAQSPLHWQVTHAASATRLQFIAHFEIYYRVGLCQERVIGR
jgi:hypothetical protein